MNEWGMFQAITKSGQKANHFHFREGAHQTRRLFRSMTTFTILPEFWLWSCMKSHTGVRSLVHFQWFFILFCAKKQQLWSLVMWHKTGGWAYIFQRSNVCHFWFLFQPWEHICISPRNFTWMRYLKLRIPGVSPPRVLGGWAPEDLPNTLFGTTRVCCI